MLYDIKYSDDELYIYIRMRIRKSFIDKYVCTFKELVLMSQASSSQTTTTQTIKMRIKTHTCAYK